MNANELVHHGVLNMHWGVRRYQNKDGTLTSLGKARKVRKKDKNSEDFSSDSSSSKKSSKKTVKDLSNEELAEKIKRLEMEKKYRDLKTEEAKVNVSAGKKFVMGVLETSGKNIATQYTTYLMGTAINTLSGSEVVNPKKGQKDK